MPSFQEIGALSWAGAWLQAKEAYANSRMNTEVSSIVSEDPEIANPRGDSYPVCQAAAPDFDFQLKKTRAEETLLPTIDTFLPRNRWASSVALSQELPLITKLSAIPISDWYRVGRRLIVAGQKVRSENASARAAIHLAGYALIGISVGKMPAYPQWDCQQCVFRFARPNRKYCSFHGLTHDLKGSDNVYSERQRERAIKQLFFENEEKIRGRFGMFLLGLPSGTYDWSPLIDAVVVTGNSVKWITRILSECADVNKLLGKDFESHIANRHWDLVFQRLQEKIDPIDQRRNLDVWCQKLLSAQAWLVAETTVKGVWSNHPILDRTGKELRSGQHSGGRRGPKAATRAKMDEVLRLARQGQSVEKIADQLNLKPRVIQQWGERHPDFSKRFILNLEIGERSRRKRG
jgi:hypothetical protein